MRTISEPTAEEIAHRRITGAHVFDEMWDGVVHVVPPPSGHHQLLGSELHLALAPVAKAIGLDVLYETGLFDPIQQDENYRVPDLSVFEPHRLTRRGLEVVRFAVEIRSPGDETYEKLPFYAARGVEELLVIVPWDPSVELYRLGPDGLLRVQPDLQGSVRSVVLDLGFRAGDGEASTLVLTLPDGAEIVI